MFKKNHNEIFLRVVEVAFKKKNDFTSLLQPLGADNKFELFLFNSVIASSYMLNNRIIPLDEEILTSYQSVVCIYAEKIKELDQEFLFGLIFDRIENYGKELNLVANTQFTEKEHFPLYFYRRVYHHPLKLNNLPEIQKWDEEYYEGDMLLDIYKHHVNSVKEGISKVL